MWAVMSASSSARWGADLVVDDLELLALGGQAQHGLGEVAAACRVDPTGAQDQVVAAARADAVFALGLVAP